jgi:ATPase subunit of ABC transporter with duplicated ATPase domains
MTDEFEAQLRQKSPEDLRDTAQNYRSVGWDKQAELAEEILSEKSTPEPQEEEQDEVAELRKELEWYEENSWESNAERVRCRLAEMGELSSTAELSHSAELQCSTVHVYSEE